MFSRISLKFCMLLMTVVFSIGNINFAYAIDGASTNGEWEYVLAPLFLWAQGMEGTSSVGPVTAPLDVTFEDALSNFEMKRDALTLFA